ncbi:MAG: hypothetical protein M0010_21815 [Actinomycetota bacterium]|nr:hypothetical protein [Actinomycetota bacterium]
MVDLERLSAEIFHVLAERQDLVDPSRYNIDAHTKALPKVAANHLAGSLAIAAVANRMAFHAIALSLARHSFEAMTIVELGLVNTQDSWSELTRWSEGRATAGSLRKWLEARMWSSYNSGIFDESWTSFMRRLGKTLQPYAHFSPELLQWNFSLVEQDSAGSPRLAGIGPIFFDRDKAARLEVLRGVLLWSVGQLLLMDSTSGDHVCEQLRPQIEAVRDDLRQSEWLIGRQDWELNLIPHIWSV